MNDLVSIKKNNVVCSSIQVAKDFEKPHKDVLKKIDNLLRKNTAKNFALFQMFKLSKYKSENGFQKCYLMNRDGFSLLVMRFTGDKALEWQIKYINAFNKMEQLLLEKKTPEYQQLRLYDKEYQKDQMQKLDIGIPDKNPIKYIKANTIADKAVSIKFGYPKAIKKENMTSEMLKEREVILNQIISLMVAKSLGVEIKHISSIIYDNIKQSLH